MSPPVQTAPGVVVPAFLPFDPFASGLDSTLWGQLPATEDFPPPEEAAAVSYSPADDAVIIIPFSPVPSGSGAGNGWSPPRLPAMPFAKGAGNGGGGGDGRVGGGGKRDDPPRLVLERTSYGRVAGTDPLLDVAAARMGGAIGDALVVVGEGLLQDPAMTALAPNLATMNFNGRLAQMMAFAGTAALFGLPPEDTAPAVDFDILRLSSSAPPAEEPLRRYWFFGDGEPPVIVSYRSLSAEPPSGDGIGPEMYSAWRQRAWSADLHQLGGLLFQNGSAGGATQPVDARLLSYERSLALRLEAEAAERAEPGSRAHQPLFSAVWDFFAGLARYLADPTVANGTELLGDFERVQGIFDRWPVRPDADIIAEPR